MIYGRYISKIEDLNIEFSRDILNLIDDYFKKPTFDSWKRFGGLCIEDLLINGDKFAIEFKKTAKKELDEESNKKAKNILEEINRLRSNHEYKPQKKMQIQHVLEAMRLLRNFRAHEWDDNSILQPLVNTGIKDFIIEKLEEFFKDFNIYIIQPYSVKKDHIEAFVCKNGEKSIQNFDRDETLPLLEETYIMFYQEENPFSFFTKLLTYSIEDNRIYLYSNYRGGKAVFENLPIIGGLEKKTVEYDDLRDIFNIFHKKFDNEQFETFEQKFGKVFIDNDIIHNLPKRLDGFIHRDEIEIKFIEKLSHRRLYILTLDGGGGFGKTELSKEVIWSIVKRDSKHIIPQQLEFKYIIWVTGKVEYFNDGNVDIKDQSFNTLEDLLDSILYITRQYNLIDKPIEEKRNKVIEIMNDISSTILVLDNLETVIEKDLVWDFLIQLGNEIKTNLKILITSRTRGGYGDQRLNIRAMKQEEANKFIISEMKRLDVNSQYQMKKPVKKIAELTGSIPLLIRYFVSLLAHGYNIDEMTKNMPKESENALNFICNFQWNELNSSSKKLLMGIAFNGGALNFAQAKLLCNFSDTEFGDAKEELQDRSFLIDDMLIDSKLIILPPISKYTKIKLEEFPEIDEEFKETQKLIKVPSNFDLSNQIQTYLFTDEIALSQIFQRADLLIRRGAIDEAYQWYNQAVKRFPDNVLAWRSKGEFEYKYLKDDIEGKRSYEKAIKLNRKDPLNYSSLAYWEYDRGKEYDKKINLKKSIKLNEKALNYSLNDDFSKKIKNYIALALRKLVYISKAEANRSYEKQRWELTKMIDQYCSQIIKILGNNLYPENTENYQQIRHNLIGYHLLSNAFLMLGGRNDSKRRFNDLKAISYLISGFKFDQNNTQLKYTLGHPGVKNNLQNFNIIYTYPNNSVIEELLNIEKDILNEINNFGNT